MNLFIQINTNQKKENMSHHDKLLEAFETYKAENEKFQGKGIKASAARARKAHIRK